MIKKWIFMGLIALMILSIAGCEKDASGQAFSSIKPVAKCKQVYLSCEDMGKECGAWSDGCKKIDCGTCLSGYVCSNGVCVVNQTCTPKTCSQLNKTCGSWSNGCSGTINCGTCAAGQTCSNGQCIVSTCVPKTCSQMNKTCGSWNNGCNSTISCGSCAAGQLCTNGVCITNATANTCLDSDNGLNFNVLGYVNYTYNSERGSVADWCQGSDLVNEYYCNGNNVASANYSCAMSGKTCQYGACVAPPCTPKTCSQLNKTCGTWSNGCNATVTCGTCSSGQSCSNGICITNTTSDSCLDSDNGLTFNVFGYVNYTLNGQRGSAYDWCQGSDILNEYYCNGNRLAYANYSCSLSGKTCQNGACVASVCTPKTCSQLNKTCGSWNNGCNATISCGYCQAGYYCGNGNCILNQTVPDSCWDFDGGNLPYVFGFVNVTQGGTRNVYFDTCIGNFTLTEYYCSGTQYRSVSVTCNQSVSYCANGECTYY